MFTHKGSSRGILNALVLKFIASSLVLNVLAGPVSLAGDTIIGGRCFEKEECVSPGYSDCISGICQCISGYTSTPDFTGCLKMADELGEKCNNSVQCQKGVPGPYSECKIDDVGFGECRCTDKGVSIPGEHFCHKIAEVVGEPCLLDIQCQVDVYGRCNPETSLCDCHDTWIALPDNSRCVQKKAYGESCMDDVQCKDLHEDFGKCLQAAGEGQCLCDERSVFVSDKCHKLAEFVGETCEFEEQCAGIDAKCDGASEKTCVCPEGFIESSNGQKCLQLQHEIGATCQETSQCQVSNSSCIQGKCQCTAGLVNPDPHRCLMVRNEINLECEDDMQCTEGLGDLSGCIDNVCQCRGSYGYYNNHCFIPSKLGQPCGTDEQCFIVAGASSSCVEDEDGIGRCRCNAYTKEFEGKCYSTTMKLGEACANDVECLTSITGGQVYCEPVNRVCRCKAGFQPANEEGMACVVIPPPPPTL